MKDTQAPPIPNTISIQEIIQMRMAYDQVKETPTTREIITAFDKVILIFASDLTPKVNS